MTGPGDGRYSATARRLAHYVRLVSEAPSIWRNRDVALLVGGNTINEIGDWLLELALPLYVFAETGSPTTTAALYLVRLLIGALCGPLGGRLVDSWLLRATLVGTNLLQAIALLPLLTVTSDRIWPVFIVVVLQGLIGSVNDPAGFAVVPRLVDGDQLVATNNGMSVGQSLARLIGAAAGGIAVGFGGLGWVVIANAVSFLIAAVAAGLLSEAADRRTAAIGDRADDPSIRAGLDAVRTTTGLRPLLAISAVTSIVFGAFPISFIAFVDSTIGGSEADVGLMRATVAVAALVGSAVIGRHADRIRSEDLMTFGLLGFTGLGYLWVNAPEVTTALWVSYLGYGATGFPNIAFGVGARSTSQRICPPDVLGRVGGLRGAIGAVSFGVGAMGAGLLLEVTSPQVVLNLEVTLFAVATIISWFFVRAPLQARDEVTSSAP